MEDKECKLGEEVFRDGTWAITIDRKIFGASSDPDTYTVVHRCPDMMDYKPSISPQMTYRFRPYSFLRCKYCKEDPPEGFQVMYKFLLQSKGEKIDNLKSTVLGNDI